jgi:hypothetical protein
LLVLFWFELFLAPLCHLAWLVTFLAILFACRFSYHLLVFAVFLLLDDILEFFVGF